MKNKKYQLRATTDSEYKRLRKEFEAIKKRIDTKQKINPEERDFFCTCIQLSLNTIDGHIFDYPECKWNYGLHLFYVYGHDLTGGGKYKNSKGYINDENIIKMELSHAEEIISQWDQLIHNTNQSSSRLLIETAKELKEQFDELKRQSEYNEYGFFRKCLRYSNKKKKITLRNLAIYVLVEEFLFQTPRNELELHLNGKRIYITEFSLIHILNRHFAGLSQEYDRRKTYHNEDVDFRGIHTFLKRIFNLIDGSQLLETWLNTHKHVVFQWKNTNYIVFWETSNIIQNTEIRTFYPLSNDEFNLKYRNLKKVTLSERLSIYS